MGRYIPPGGRWLYNIIERSSAGRRFHQEHHCYQPYSILAEFCPLYSCCRRRALQLVRRCCLQLFWVEAAIISLLRETKAIELQRSSVGPKRNCCAKVAATLQFLGPVYYDARPSRWSERVHRQQTGTQCNIQHLAPSNLVQPQPHNLWLLIDASHLTFINLLDLPRLIHYFRNLARGCAMSAQRTPMRSSFRLA